MDFAKISFIIEMKTEFRKNSRRLSDSKWWVAISTTFTIYGLFGDDIKHICFESASDGTFDVLTITAVVFFTTEIVLTCVSQKDYFLSFFFILDAISTATLLLDVSSISATMTSGIVSKASRAGRAGTRASRIIRVIRLVRLLRISRVFKAFLKKRTLMHSEDDAEHETDSTDMHQSTKLRDNQMGAELSKLTSQRVIILVLLIVFVVPQFSVTSQFSTVSDLHQAGISSVSYAYKTFLKQCRSGSTERASEARLIYEKTLLLYATHGTSVPEKSPKLGWIGANITNNSHECLTGNNSPFPSFNWLGPNTTYISERLLHSWNDTCDSPFVTTSGIPLTNEIGCTSQLRSSDKSKIVVIEEDFDFEIVIDMRPYNRSECLLSIYRTLVICFILGIGSFAFSEDAFKLVLDPIERMMTKVDKLRENPLHASKMDDDTVKREELQRLQCIARYNTATGFVGRWRAKRDLARLNKGTLETDMLEKTIVRISGLLALGFGQAGADIVAHNMKPTDPSINVMLPGAKVKAVFVSIRVKHFPIISAILKDKVVLFMNQLAEIVHGITDEFNGMPNKSDSGSFLMVWRLTDDADKNRQINDMAVAACVKISIAIARSLELHEYNSLPPLMQKVPGFRVELNFGLHRGWAIEGAIGSDLKIDASYLGPDVNLVESLADLNTKYGTRILASNDLVDSCDSSISKSLFRRIDRVRFGMNHTDLHIYSLDLDPNAALLSQYEIDNSVQATSLDTNRHRQVREREKRKAARWSTDLLFYLFKDKYFHMLRGVYQSDPTLKSLFDKGFLNYEAGEWDVATQALEERNESLTDGPSLRLLEFMKSQSQTAPQEWAGFRLCKQLLYKQDLGKIRFIINTF